MSTSPSGPGDANRRLYPEVAIAYVHGLDARAQRWIVSVVTEQRVDMKAHGMTISAQATEVTFDEDRMWAALEDGRTIGVPLAWYPRLLNGSAADRAKAWIPPSGIHWDELDEDISIAGLLARRGDMTQSSRHAA